MSSEGALAIAASGVGKRYRIGADFRPDTFREWVTLKWSRARSSFGRNPEDAQREHRSREFWALKGVNFEICRGDIVGIVGRNGAGKSTLLKMISRVTRPTTGVIDGWGRVGSLLEVGTGFHPELTGRENVFLSGAVLGMRRAEILRKFDRIVEFADIGPFLDTPVKRYSSGMYVRLGFAVAAYLEPDILVVDEVLAVGDVAFQRKCLELMTGLAYEGRTILLVSHNMGTVSSFCGQGLLFDGGELTAQGHIQDVVSAYLKLLEVVADRPLGERRDRGGQGAVRLESVQVGVDDSGSGSLVAGGPAVVRLRTDEARPGLSCSFTIYDALGVAVTWCDSAIRSPVDDVPDDRQHVVPTEFVCQFDELLLRPGRYRINAALYADGRLQDHIESAAIFEVQPGAVRGRRVEQDTSPSRFTMPHRWVMPSEPDRRREPLA